MKSFSSKTLLTHNPIHNILERSSRVLTYYDNLFVITLKYKPEMPSKFMLFIFPVTLFVINSTALSLLLMLIYYVRGVLKCFSQWRKF